MLTIIVRTIIIYLTLIISMRLLGKRQLGQLELSEFVLAAVAADLVSQPLQDINIPLINGLVPVLLLFSIEVLISYHAMKSPRFRSMLRGKPSILVKEGQIQPSELRKNRLSTDELCEELREQGCIDISETEYAVLETDGSLSLILFPSKRPVSAEQAGLDGGQGGYPRAVICGGRLLEKNLNSLGLDRRWLTAYLKTQGISDPKEVFYMSINEHKQVYLCRDEI